jgi:hypothetical protein
VDIYNESSLLFNNLFAQVEPSAAALPGYKALMREGSQFLVFICYLATYNQHFTQFHPCNILAPAIVRLVIRYLDQLLIQSPTTFTSARDPNTAASLSSPLKISNSLHEKLAQELKEAVQRIQILTRDKNIYQFLGLA